MSAPVNKRHQRNVGPMLGQRRRRRTNIGPTLGRYVPFSVISWLHVMSRLPLCHFYGFSLRRPNTTFRWI